jgi:hypothetical protein
MLGGNSAVSKLFLTVFLIPLFGVVPVMGLNLVCYAVDKVSGLFCFINSGMNCIPFNEQLVTVTAEVLATPC